MCVVNSYLLVSLIAALNHCCNLFALFLNGTLKGGDKMPQPGLKNNMVTKCSRFYNLWGKRLRFSKGVEALHTLCFLRECRACLMVSYSSPCSASVMARQDESVFNLSSFIAAQRKELQSKGEDGACLA